MNRWAAESWRILLDIDRANPGATVEQRRKLARAAYPFGERAMHPYKMWGKCVREWLRRGEP